MSTMCSAIASDDLATAGGQFLTFNTLFQQRTEEPEKLIQQILRIEWYLFYFIPRHEDSSSLLNVRLVRGA